MEDTTKVPADPIMPVHILAAARYLVEVSGCTLSNLVLQKILYIAHMFHLGRHESPLVSGHFEAWEYGPVHPVLYHKVKRFGADPVTEIEYPLTIKEETHQELLDEALDALGQQSGAQLISITHWKEGAWAKNYVPGVNARISDGDILEEYNRRAEIAEENSGQSADEA